MEWTFRVRVHDWFSNNSKTVPKVREGNNVSFGNILSQSARAHQDDNGVWVLENWNRTLWRNLVSSLRWKENPSLRDSNKERCLFSTNKNESNYPPPWERVLCGRLRENEEGIMAAIYLDDFCGGNYGASTRSYNDASLRDKKPPVWESRRKFHSYS